MNNEKRTDPFTEVTLSKEWAEIQQSLLLWTCEELKMRCELPPLFPLLPVELPQPLFPSHPPEIEPK